MIELESTVRGAKKMTDRNFQVRALGEVAIRCKNRAAMIAFYRDVIGLNLMNDPDAPVVFFNLGNGYAGHTSVLAMFSYDMASAGNLAAATQPPVAGTGSSLHHIALTVPYAEQEAVIAWYDALDQPYKVELFDWIGWRGIFTTDPEGNTVELVAKDPDWSTPARSA